MGRLQYRKAHQDIHDCVSYRTRVHLDESPDSATFVTDNDDHNDNNLFETDSQPAQDELDDDDVCHFISSRPDDLNDDYVESHLSQLEEIDDTNILKELLQSHIHNDIQDDLDPTDPDESPNRKPSFTISDHAMVCIYKYAMEQGVSLSFVDNLFSMIRKFLKAGFDIGKAPLRDTFMKRLRQKMGKNVTPIPQPLFIESVGTPVPYFPFLDQIMDLLQSATFQDLNNLVVNQDPSKRFHLYEVPEGEDLLEVHSAAWYKATYEMLVKDPDFDLLFPLIFYIDKTGTDAMQRFSLEPLMFTTTLIKQHIRQKSTSWRHVGFIPACDDASASAEKIMQCFHDCLSVVLKDLKEMQRNPPIIELLIDGKITKKRLLLPVAFVMGDQLSQDKHCGRKSANSGGAGKQHRQCWTSSLNASATNRQCVCVKQTECERLTDIATQIDDVNKLIPIPCSSRRRKEICSYVKRRSRFGRTLLGKLFTMYPIQNAWFDVCFGANPNGIFRATLDDPMHYLDSGSYLYMAKVCFLFMTDTERSRIESVIRSLFLGKRSSVRDDLPRSKLSSGFSRTTLQTSCEKIGLILGLYVALGLNEAVDTFKTALIRNQVKYETFPDFMENLDRQGDCHFFSDENPACNKGPMDRSDIGLNQMITTLNDHEMSFVLDNKANSFDDMHVEYLFQCLHTTKIQSDKEGYPSIKIPGVYSGSHGNIDSGRKRKKNLMLPWISKQLRKRKISKALKKSKDLHCNGRGEDSRIDSESDSSNDQHGSNTGSMQQDVKKFIPKHNLVKPKVLGMGSTAAVLTDVDGLRRLMEKMLGLHSLIHYFEMIPAADRGNVRAIDTYVRDVIKTFSQVVYRGDDSNDCNTGKMHSHLHLARDIEEYGGPMNYETELGERGLKTWAKTMSSTAQKHNMPIFLGQTAVRVADSLLLEKALDLFLSENQKQSEYSVDYFQTDGASVCQAGQQHDNEDLEEEIEKDDPVWWVENIKVRKEPHYVVIEKKNGFEVTPNGAVSVIPTIGDIFSEEVLNAVACFDAQAIKNGLKVYKNAQLMVTGGTKPIRAFSFYDRFGPFFDWVSVNWKVGQHYRQAPAKLLLIFEDTDQQLCAIVHGCRWQTKEQINQSTFISHARDVVRSSTDCKK